MNEICQDHWFYHSCQCQRPFFGADCDQSKIKFFFENLIRNFSFLVAPIVAFNQTSLANISLSSPISNISRCFLIHFNRMVLFLNLFLQQNQID